MEPPYGSCSEKAEPMSNCRIKCQGLYINKTCGCVEKYMAVKGMASIVNFYSTYNLAHAIQIF